MGGLGPNVWVWLLVKSHYLQVQHGSLGPERVNVVKPFITKITILLVQAIPSHGRFMARVWESQGSWKQVVFPPGKTSVCLVISPKSYSCFFQKQNGLMIQHHFKILQGWVVQAPSAVTLAGLGQHVEDWNCLWGSSSCKDRRGAHTHNLMGHGVESLWLKPDCQTHFKIMSISEPDLSIQTNIRIKCFQHMKDTISKKTRTTIWVIWDSYGIYGSLLRVFGPFRALLTVGEAWQINGGEAEAKMWNLYWRHTKCWRKMRKRSSVDGMF